MRKRVVLQDSSEIEYILRRRRGAKRISLYVYKNGNIVVNAPRYLCSVSYIDLFLKDRTEWILSALGNIKFSSGEEKDLYIQNRETARKFITSKCLHFASTYGFVYKNIYIRNQQTVWGSCSSKGNLNFNYKILFLPEELAEYVIVHELCHLKELNHSKRFWALLGGIIPQYESLREALKAYKL